MQQNSVASRENHFSCNMISGENTLHFLQFFLKGRNVKKSNERTEKSLLFDKEPACMWRSPPEIIPENEK